jgi:superfamily I DNA and RNA helicase
MPLRAMDLFDAFSQDKLPKDQAYIVASFINVNTGYCKYEVVSYSGVKSIYLEGEGLTFQSSGKKLHALVEPSSYPSKAIEPYLRDKSEQIPLRFKELNVHTTKNQIKIYMAKEPIESLSSFTVLRPSGENIAFVFYKTDDLYENMIKFFENSLNRDARLPQNDAKKVANLFIDVIREQMAFRSDYS